MDQKLMNNLQNKLSKTQSLIQPLGNKESIKSLPRGRIDFCKTPVKINEQRRK